MVGKWKNGRQRGDTLIEVTLALAILATILLTATATATRAFLVGFNAVERTRLANEAQNQMESVRAFRDNNTWDQFLNGNGSTFQGVLSSLSGFCKVTTPCMHMIPPNGAITEYVPTGGNMPGSVPTSYIEMTVTPGPGATPLYVDVNLSYGFVTRGGGTDSVNHIKTRFTNLDFAVVTPPPPPPPVPPTPPPFPPPANTTCAGLALVPGLIYFNLYNYNGADWHVAFHAGNGTSHPISTTFYPGASIQPGNYEYWATAKDDSPNPGSFNRQLQYIMYSGAQGNGPVVMVTQATPDFTGQNLEAQRHVSFVTINSAINSFRVEHAPNNLSNIDDSVDSACLAFRKLN